MANRSYISESGNPHPALHDFFTYYSLPDIRQQLWELLKGAVTGTEHQQPADRVGMLHFYEKLEKAMEAVHMLYTQNKTGANKNRGGGRQQKQEKAGDLDRVIYRFSKN